MTALGAAKPQAMTLNPSISSLQQPVKPGYPERLGSILHPYVSLGESYDETLFFTSRSRRAPSSAPDCLAAELLSIVVL
jgi:hypothetical protein